MRDKSATAYDWALFVSILLVGFTACQYDERIMDRLDTLEAHHAQCLEPEK